MSLCTDQGMRLKTSFWRSQKQTNRPASSLAQNANHLEGHREGEWDKPRLGLNSGSSTKGSEVWIDPWRDKGCSDRCKLAQSPW